MEEIVETFFPISIESCLPSLDGFAVVSFVARAPALFELVAALLPLQDSNRVEAALRAAAPSEHGAAEAVVVLEGGGALWGKRIHVSIHLARDVILNCIAGVARFWVSNSIDRGKW